MAVVARRVRLGDRAFMPRTPRRDVTSPSGVACPQDSPDSARRSLSRLHDRFQIEAAFTDARPLLERR
jgi:hypothetical protein